MRDKLKQIEKALKYSTSMMKDQKKFVLVDEVVLFDNGIQFNKEALALIKEISEGFALQVVKESQ